MSILMPFGCVCVCGKLFAVFKQWLAKLDTVAALRSNHACDFVSYGSCVFDGRCSGQCIRTWSFAWSLGIRPTSSSRCAKWRCLGSNCLQASHQVFSYQLGFYQSIMMHNVCVELLGMHAHGGIVLYMCACLTRVCVCVFVRVWVDYFVLWFLTWWTSGQYWVLVWLGEDELAWTPRFLHNWE